MSSFKMLARLKSNFYTTQHRDSWISSSVRMLRRQSGVRRDDVKGFVKKPKSHIIPGFLDTDYCNTNNTVSDYCGRSLMYLLVGAHL